MARSVLYSVFFIIFYENHTKPTIFQEINFNRNPSPSCVQTRIHEAHSAANAHTPSILNCHKMQTNGFILSFCEQTAALQSYGH